MTDWTSGYVADIGYTFGYSTELNPLEARLAFLNAGLVPPSQGTHCELGFGQGMSVNIHAAASASSWHATDFNPAHAGFAQSIARVSGADARLTDQSFVEFCGRSDLPDFDSIGLHGIWSWISDENRAVIVDFVRRKLKVGGVLYISYNTQPGWAAMIPVRDLLAEHVKVMGVVGQGIVSGIDGALEFAEKLFGANPNFANAHPLTDGWLKNIQGRNRNYIAHEYFNRDWHPMSFSQMAQWMMPAKLTYACSAHYHDDIYDINLTGHQQALIREIPDRMFRESVRDFIVNQGFRRDYWVKGARQLSQAEQVDALRAQSVMLTQPRADVTLKVSGSSGEVTLREAVYAPILDMLANHLPQTVAQIEEAVQGLGVTHAQVMQAVFVLVGTGSLAAVQESALITNARKSTDKLNTHLIDKARASGAISYLASPVTGGGVNVNRFEQLFLLAIREGKSQPAEWSSMVWQFLVEQDEKIIVNNTVLDTPEQNLAELNRQASAFAEKQLPILKALQIA